MRSFTANSGGDGISTHSKEGRTTMMRAGREARSREAAGCIRRRQARSAERAVKAGPAPANSGRSAKETTPAQRYARGGLGRRPKLPGLVWRASLRPRLELPGFGGLVDSGAFHPVPAISRCGLLTAALPPRAILTALAALAILLIVTASVSLAWPAARRMPDPEREHAACPQATGARKVFKA